MSQVTITNFFSKRKRQVEDLKGRSKVFVIERDVSVALSTVETDVDRTCIKDSAVKVNSETHFAVHQDKRKCESSILPENKSKIVRFDESKTTVRVHKLNKRSALCSKPPKYDIRKSFQKTNIRILDRSNVQEGNPVSEDEHQHQENAAVDEAPHVLLEKAAVLVDEVSGSQLAAGYSGDDVQTASSHSTPTEETCQATAMEASSVLPKDAGVPAGESICPQLSAGGGEDDLQPGSSLMTPTKRGPQDLSLSEIKSRLSRSEKLRQVMSKFSKASARCAQLEAARKELDKTDPQLQKFEAVEVKFCSSPQKLVQKSPEKRVTHDSPQKTSGLPLPFSYRSLAEMFRCVDVVVSMLYNRSEAVTFKKVKAAVQEMLHRTFTEQHLGQIKTVFPDAYIVHQEKLRNFGSTSKADTYELTITPLLCTNSKPESSSFISGEETSKPTDKLMMTPTCILERKRTFYNSLLERVFMQHEKFLSSLDPPLLIPRDQLARWHPQFEIDAAEEIPPEELPQPPNVKKFTSAKDVLDRAKDLFSCNQRMQNALQELSEMSGGGPKTGSHASVSTDKNITTSKQDLLQSSLKGIPKALLEKVRAKQAARAHLAMTCPAQDKESVEHSRLPELARILRNMFVTEKKVALPLELAVAKLQNSYREKLTARDLEHHIKLMVGLVPGWIAIYTIRNTDYLKLSRNGDITKVIQKLEAASLEKMHPTQVLKPA